MRLVLCWFVAALMPAVMPAAERPVATALCLGPIEFNGVRMTQYGVYSWPVVAKDEIATEALTATLLFPDKSRITLRGSTRVQLEQRPGGLTIWLLEGELGYVFEPGSALRIAVRNHPFDLRGLAGKVTFQQDRISFQPGSVPFTREPPLPDALPSLGMYRP